jgi:hypothetical protein
MLLSGASALLAQQPLRGRKPFDAQSTSEIRYYKEGPSDVIDTNNVVYDTIGERFVIRERVATKRVIGDIGIEATTTVETWPLGVDVREMPLYSITVSGNDPRVLNGDLLVISRGLEEVDWWSAYSISGGKHLFDTYVPVLHFSIARDMQVLRYAVLEVPPDDARDPRLKSPDVVAVLSYATAERVVREALITCDDPKLARVFRSFDDATRVVSFAGGNIRVSMSQNYPSTPDTVSITVPVSRDDLDLARVQAPAGIHVVPWKR